MQRQGGSRVRYEIDYLSRSENTKKLADAVEKLVSGQGHGNH